MWWHVKWKKHKKPRPRRIFSRQRNVFFSRFPCLSLPFSRIHTAKQLCECVFPLWLARSLTALHAARREWGATREEICSSEKLYLMFESFLICSEMYVSYTNNSRNITQLNWVFFCLLLAMLACFFLSLPPSQGIKSNDVHWCLNSFHNVFIYYV